MGSPYHRMGPTDWRSAEPVDDGNHVAWVQNVNVVSSTPPESGSAAITSVASGTSSVTILAANADRAGASIVNTDANVLYLDLSGGTASATSFTAPLLQNGYFEVPYGFTGAITGIWAGDGSGAAIVTEYE